MKHSSQFLYLYLYFHFQINIEFVNRNSALITTCDSRINSLLKKFSYEKLKCNEGISQIINGKYIYVQNVLILLIMKMKNVN